MQGRHARFGIAWAGCFALSGCAVVEAVIEPRASDVLAVRADTTTQRVFDCAQASVAAVSARGRHWDTRVSRIDSARGVIETGDFARSSRVGFRSQVVHSPDAGLVFIRLKGAGPYYIDLGVDRTVLDLQSRVRECLVRTSPITAAR